MPVRTCTGTDAGCPSGVKNGLVTTVADTEPETPVKRRSLVRGLVKTIRPSQWVKNVFVMAPMVFHKDLVSTTSGGDAALNLRVTGQAIVATMVFCLLAGAVYTMNDLVDVQADRVHPVKRFRPIPNGDVPENVARLFAVALVAAGLGIAFTKFNPWFGAVAAFYMTACTALLALFLGFGKRRHELEGEHAGKQRKALEAYGKTSLTVALGLTGLATAATYFAYTLDKDTEAFFQTDKLWLTAPFTVFGIVRFLFLVSGRAGRGRKAESPTQELLSDVPSMLNLVAWIIVVFAIVYRLRPS